MKVVLFCGGYGMRMREQVSDPPKPMAMVGPRPLLWHVMRYYAYYGHHEFVLCLGYGSKHIKDFFLHYEETASNDFVFRNGEIELLGNDIADWTISFVETGLDSPIGERLRRVREHLGGDEVFLANYADILTDVPLPEMIERFEASDAVGSMLVVPPQNSFHCVELTPDQRISSIIPVSEMPIWENGGYFVLRQEIFEHVPPGGDLVMDGCAALAARNQLLAYPYRGFWRPTDTAKERHALDVAYYEGSRPWARWEHA